MKPRSQRLSLFLIILAFLSSQTIPLNCDLSNVTNPVEITEENFDNEVLMANLPVILQLYAPSCPQSQTIDPVFKNVCQKYGKKIIFAKLNIDENHDFTKEIDIEDLPTVAIFYKGTLFEQLEVSDLTEKDFEELCEEILFLTQAFEKYLQPYL